MPRNPDIDDIIYKYPSWTLRWGTFSIFLFVSILLLISWLIKYPEIIESEASLITNTVPTSVVSKSSGQLIYFIEPNVYVKEGRTLGLISNPAKYEDVFLIQRLITQDKIDSILSCNFQLGELQRDFTTWQAALRDYDNFTKFSFFEKKISALQEQIVNYSNLQTETHKVLVLSQEELEIEMNRYKTDSLLHVQKVIADRDFQDSKITLISKILKVKNAKSAMENINIQVQEITNSILDFELQRENEKRKLFSIAESSKNNLLSSMDIWENKYILKAPIEGTVVFFNFHGKNQFANAGDEVFYVAPSNEKTEIKGRMLIPLMNSGKVKVGQTINIKLHDFHYKEFGVLKGMVEKISIIQLQNSYLVEFTLPNGFVTTYKREIAFKNKMTGLAEIIIDDTRLIERIFYNFKYIYTQENFH